MSDLREISARQVVMKVKMSGTVSMIGFVKGIVVVSQQKIAKFDSNKSTKALSLSLCLTNEYTIDQTILCVAAEFYRHSNRTLEWAITAVTT